VSETQRKQDNISAPSLQSTHPAIYKKIYDLATKLTEEYGYSPQEIEFTFESDKEDDFYILQTRDQDLKSEHETDTFILTPEEMTVAGRGIGIGGGSLNGIAAFDEEDLERLKKEFPDKKMILIRPDTVPDDIGMIFICDGLITARGGATSHAAVTAARLGKTCVVNCSGLLVDEANRTCILEDKLIQSGDLISIDGNLGNIYLGHHPIEKSSFDSEYRY
jgi:pyruvate,orthophosphate dikinase